MTVDREQIRADAVAITNDHGQTFRIAYRTDRERTLAAHCLALLDELANVPALVDALRLYVWQDSPVAGWPICAACDGIERDGHKDSCPVKAALAEWGDVA